MPNAWTQADTLFLRLKATRFRPAGFDYLRIGLAVAVIVLHSTLLSRGISAGEAAAAAGTTVAGGASLLHQLAAVVHRIRPGNFVLPMFFSLSGFLVAGSLERTSSLPTFLGLRVLRIVPALAVEVTLGALVLRPLLTAWPLSAYFADPRLYAYFGNILGDIHYLLPGMFLHNPLPETVNGQLWTIPYELICYISLSAIALVGIFRRRFLLLATVAAVCLWLTWQAPTGAGDGALDGALLVVSFLAGVLLFRFSGSIPWSRGLFAASVVLAVASSWSGLGQAFSSLPIAYMTVYLGLLNPPRAKLLFSGDYSYGLYLYGYPLQQAVASYGPATRHWYINLAIALPLAALVAVCSWWGVERRALELKGRVRELDLWVTARVVAAWRATLGSVLPAAAPVDVALDSRQPDQ
jgi:peptidoglycan/LPS O-acetylase OafA/YrhL